MNAIPLDHRRACPSKSSTTSPTPARSKNRGRHRRAVDVDLCRRARNQAAPAPRGTASCEDVAVERDRFVERLRPDPRNRALDHPDLRCDRGCSRPAVSSPMMARLDDPRPRRRRRVVRERRAIACRVGLGLSTVSPLRLPPAGDRSPTRRRSVSPSADASGAASTATPPAPSASILTAPTPDPLRTAGREPDPSGNSSRQRFACTSKRNWTNARARLGIPGVSVDDHLRRRLVVDRDQRPSRRRGTRSTSRPTRRSRSPASARRTRRRSSWPWPATARSTSTRRRGSYLPEAALDTRITVRQLLNHTSGLDDFFLHPPIDKALLAERDAFWSVRRTLRYVAKPYFPPGRGWHYSNTNYVYLGLIAERVTGVPLAIALRERFFGPARPRRDVVPGGREADRGPLAHGYRFVGPEADGTADRPVGKVAGRAVHGRSSRRPPGPARSQPPRPMLHAGRGSSTAARPRARR